MVAPPLPDAVASSLPLPVVGTPLVPGAPPVLVPGAVPPVLAPEPSMATSPEHAGTSVAATIVSPRNVWGREAGRREECCMNRWWSAAVDRSPRARPSERE
jgi:hypothetical protein